ncbi:hypothetical protein [Klebsiella quasipneumoniae]|uniref:hypothetical protein n=1 Tax=Klebsiella quasipneumoniae TaxID=1463165 RepID=UPI0038795867
MNAANDNINNATAKLPIFRYYNIREDVIHASADGQSSKPGARPSKPVIRRSTLALKRCFCHDLDRQSRCDQRQSDRRQRT